MSRLCSFVREDPFFLCPFLFFSMGVWKGQDDSSRGREMFHGASFSQLSLFRSPCLGLGPVYFMAARIISLYIHHCRIFETYSSHVLLIRQRSLGYTLHN